MGASWPARGLVGRGPEMTMGCAASELNVVEMALGLSYKYLWQV